MMADTFRVKIDGLKDGVVKDQVVYQLVILFKRSQHDVQRILDHKGTTVKKGLELESAIKYKFAIEQCGCVCVIEPDRLPGLATDPNSDFMAFPEPEQPAIPPGQMSLLDIAPPKVEEKIEPVLKPAPVIKKEVPEKSTSTRRNTIGITVHDEPFMVYTPQTNCCNCGTDNDLSTIGTQFYRNFFFSTKFDKEKAITLDLPYCPSCAEEIGKYPMSPALKWLIAFCVWFGGFFLMMAISGGAQLNLLMRLLLVALPVIPAVIAFHLIGRPRSPKTSACTPVIIKEFSRNPNSVRDEGRGMVVISAIAAVLGFIFKKLNNHDPEKVTKFSIKFSNRSYGKEFKKKNKNFIQEGLIKVL